jgi:dynamin 1-like protein
LENIVGLDFLPRGDGVVTRRPLELRLVHEHAGDEYKPWAEFDQERGKKYYDFAQVKQKIEEFTDKVAGKNKGIIRDPILLTIHSPNCPDLTLVDLPGITRIPMAGSD